MFDKNVIVESNACKMTAGGINDEPLIKSNLIEQIKNLPNDFFFLEILFVCFYFVEILGI